VNLVLISTSDLSSKRFDVLERMVRSVEREVAARPQLSTSVLLLLQKCPEYLYWSVSKGLPPFVQAIPTIDPLSLSAARNVLLQRASSIGIVDDRTVVGFPDDDCWYPEGTLDYVTHLFALRPQLDLWFCRYASNPACTSDLALTSRVAAPRDVVRQASSNTMFVRGRVLTESVAFDETLGVGTINGGGEDTEFALRAHLLSRESLYLPAPIIGHRDKVPQLRPKYYRGALIALARHARQEPRVVLELARKIAVGLWLVGTRQLPLMAFVRAVIAAARSGRTTAAQA
jgi:hypothetical protein